MQTLKEHLQTHKETDIAMYHLGMCLGVFPPEATFLEVKGVLWTHNPSSTMLFETLRSMAEAGILEEDDDGFVWRETA